MTRIYWGAVISLPEVIVNGNSTPLFGLNLISEPYQYLTIVEGYASRIWPSMRICVCTVDRSSFRVLVPVSSDDTGNGVWNVFFAWIPEDEFLGQQENMTCLSIDREHSSVQSHTNMLREERNPLYNRCHSLFLCWVRLTHYWER